MQHEFKETASVNPGNGMLLTRLIKVDVAIFTLLEVDIASAHLLQVVVPAPGEMRAIVIGCAAT
jgi:hypothetical protein